METVLKKCIQEFQKGLQKSSRQDISRISPTIKRIRLELGSEDESEMSQKKYEEAVKTLQDEYKKSGKHKNSSSSVKHLLDKTRRLRLKWVQDEFRSCSKVPTFEVK